MATEPQIQQRERRAELTQINALREMSGILKIQGMSWKI